MMDIQEEVDDLRKKINRANHFYYCKDQPEVSDATYDSWMQRLREIEENCPSLVTSDSPTQRVGCADCSIY